MWKNFVLCKITVISAIHVGKTESETNTVVFTTYLPSPFLPTPFGLSLTLWQDITRPFHLFPVCELFFPLLVFLTLPCLCTFGLCVFVELTAAALPAHFRFIIYQHQFSWIFTSVFTRFFKSVNILVMQWPTYKFKNFLYWLRSSLCFSVPQVHYFLCFPHSSLCLLAATQLPHVPLSLPRASRNHQLPLIYTITHFLTTKHFHQV